MRIFSSSEYDSVSLGKAFWTFWRTVVPSSSWPSIILGLLDTEDRGTNYHLLKYQDLDLQYHHPQNLKYCMLWEIYYIFLVWNFSLFLGTTAPPWTRASPFTRFLDHTQRRTTVGRTPLDKWSARRRDLYLTTHTKLTTDKRPCLWWDSNPQSQQVSGRRSTP